MSVYGLYGFKPNERLMPAAYAKEMRYQDKHRQDIKNGIHYDPTNCLPFIKFSIWLSSLFDSTSRGKDKLWHRKLSAGLTIRNRSEDYAF